MFESKQKLTEIWLYSMGVEGEEEEAPAHWICKVTRLSQVMPRGFATLNYCVA